VIDGEVTSYFEWVGAGRYQPDNRSGAMHRDEPRIRDVYYGEDSDNFYLRLDFDQGFQLHSLEVQTEDQTISLLDNPAVESAQQRILEIRMPILPAGGRFRLGVNGATLPPDSWLET
jgi:hypothetical protein